MTRSIEMIRYNVQQGISSFEDTRVLMARYDMLMEQLRLMDTEDARAVYSTFKKGEKHAD